ncbi:hypothetical protein [Microbacterium marinilacus]|uniref:Gram-positive cocci surface proteins LPxTG domain-containing protein n=1 Tax=Microbacterium marinilacus TaxID=415209 RepID=A0ABP7BGU7_9MICO|nr:hypothetical protein [Microbacterium marinilacus]MBY0689585.1 hypothetical protein [Microbacterium marinilacus]
MSFVPSLPGVRTRLAASAAALAMGATLVLIAAQPASAATSHSIDFGAEGYALGQHSPDGQPAEAAAADSWSGGGGDWDYALVENSEFPQSGLGDGRSLRVSNGQAPARNRYLHSPNIEAAGEPESGAAWNTFETSFTVASASGGLQPGLSVDVNIDSASRYGGVLNLHHGEDGLEIGSFWVPEEATSAANADWVSTVFTTVDPSVPHDIRIVTVYRADASDSYDVYVDDELVSAGSGVTTWEHYTRLVGTGNDHTVDEISFKYGASVPSDDGRGYVSVPVAPDTLGYGYLFSDISYEVSNTSLVTPTPTPTATPTPSPTPTLTATPTPSPTPTPTATPTPSPEPTTPPVEPGPTPTPTAAPTSPPGEPSPEPTVAPTPGPTGEPTPDPTGEPTPEPTAAPTPGPTASAPPESSSPSPTTSPVPTDPGSSPTAPGQTGPQTPAGPIVPDGPTPLPTTSPQLPAEPDPSPDAVAAVSSDDEISATRVISFRAAGFLPFENVHLTFFSTPVFGGWFQADAAGVVSGEVEIPAALGAGTHTLQLTGEISGWTAVTTFELAAAEPSGLAATGADTSTPLLAAAALLGAGALFLGGSALRRRRAG